MADATHANSGADPRPKRLIAVAVPVPALGVLTYAVPDRLEVPPSGARVVVPLGTRTVTGLVLGEGEALEAGVEVREILEALDTAAFVPGDVVALARWVADYYLAGPGAALAAAVPPHGLTTRVDAFKTVRVARLTDRGRDMLDRLLGPQCAGSAEADLPRLGTRQREALQILATFPEGLTAPSLSDRGVPASALTRLQTLGVIALSDARVERDPFAGERHAASSPGADAEPHQLMEEQQRAFETLADLATARRFHTALLHGVTGSGKTELYLRLAERVRTQGRGVLVLVPEIALTPQVAALFRRRFGSHVAIQHSGLSDGERHDQWHRIRRGEVDVVVGTRSAIFAPLARPGLIVVDEEHDTSYKQEDTPRYHGRDVAVMRGKLSDALVVLGSATPSMESYANARAGRYTLVTMSRRVLDRSLAEVNIVNMREEMAEEPEVVLSRALVAGLGQRLEAREQAVILLNRRGYATAMFCRQCGNTLECPNCSVSLTLHRGKGDSPRRHSDAGDSPRRHSDAGDSPQRQPETGTVPDRRGWKARCHYCNYMRAVPTACPQCAAPYLEHIGYGTERIEAEVRRHFPAARIARVDRDTVRRKGSLVEVLSRFARREVDVLVGTQMIAKGHDFPHVTLVGVVSADVGLGLADFRAAERTFQLLTQVAGRAGRGDARGEAIVQTLFPTHYSIRLACKQDYVAMFERETAYRLAMRYPPHVAMVNVVVRGRTFAEAMEGAQSLAAAVRGGGRGFALLGPAPAPLTRLRGEHRAQFFLKGTNRAAMREALRTALQGAPQVARRATVDVDPVTVL
jgi:primosomal protein N' (replication factor Y)